MKRWVILGVIAGLAAALTTGTTAAAKAQKVSITFVVQ